VAANSRRGLEFAEDFAAAGAHGWGADLGEFLEEGSDLGFEFGVCRG